MKNNVKIVAYLCLLPVMLFSQELKPPQQTVPMRIAYDEYFFSVVKKNDAIAALNIWAKSFVKELEIHAKIKPDLSLYYIDNMNDVLKTNSYTNFDLLNMLSTDYVRYANRDYWIPIAVSVDDGHIPEEYLLIVREGKGLTDLKSLQGKSIAILKGPDSRFSRMWLQNQTLENFKMPANTFFEQINEEDKVSKVVLDVFFKKVDACLVGFNAYQIMTELNPQLKKKLKILKTSPGFIKGLVCLRKDFNPELYSDVLNGIFSLTNSESGNQILKLFGESRLIPYEPGFLVNIEKLVSEHQKLTGSDK